jgi:hypothetical protein
MVEHRLDDVRQDAKLGHMGRSRTAQIMPGPMIELGSGISEAPIQFVRALCPGGISPGYAEDEFALPSRTLGKHVLSWPR